MKKAITLFCASAIGLILAAPAAAQDPLEQLMKLDRLTRGQRATMEAEVSMRAGRLRDAGMNPQLRSEAKDRILKTAATAGATSAALEAYAEICSEQLTGLVTGEVVETAMEAVMILAQLNNASTADALAAGLRSRHAAVRVMSARALQRLQDLIKDDQAKCRNVLRALGRAGAREQDEHALRVIYQAVDFKVTVRNFKHGDLAAQALADIFQGRLAQLDAGSRDEFRDEAGLEAAARCYADGGRAEKTRLISFAARLLEIASERYFDPDTASESLAMIARYIGRIEEIIHEMAKASAVTLSCDRLRLNPRAADKSDQQAATQKAIDCIYNALAEDPWRLR